MRRAVATAALAVAFASACAGKKAATPDAAAPAEGAAMGGAMPDDIDAIEEELARYESELRIEGAGPEREMLETEDAGASPDTAGQGTPAAVPPDRCARICELTESICELEARVCTLAGDHDGEPRYAAACTRAGENCARGREACNACCG